MKEHVWYIVGHETLFINNIKIWFRLIYWLSKFCVYCSRVSGYVPRFTVYVQECCLCTRVLSMYQSAVYVPQCCQCTKVVSMYQSDVNEQVWCLCTRVLSMYTSGVYVPKCCQCTRMVLCTRVLSMYQSGVYVPMHRPNIFVVPHMIPWKVYEWSNLPLTKFDFQ